MNGRRYATGECQHVNDKGNWERSPEPFPRLTKALDAITNSRILSLESQKGALDSARKEAKEAEALWYGRIQAIDAQRNAIEEELIRLRGY